MIPPLGAFFYHHSQIALHTVASRIAAPLSPTCPTIDGHVWVSCHSLSQTWLFYLQSGKTEKNQNSVLSKNNFQCVDSLSLVSFFLFFNCSLAMFSYSQNFKCQFKDFRIFLKRFLSASCSVGQHLFNSRMGSGSSNSLVEITLTHTLSRCVIKILVWPSWHQLQIHCHLPHNFRFLKNQWVIRQ